MVSSFEIATQFAELMDNNLYDQAGKLMSSDCIYKYKNNLLKGNEIILKTYIDNFQWASKTFDQVEFSSKVEQLTDIKFKLKYLDKLRKNMEWHEHRCVQIITIRNGQVNKIEHIDLEGEQESLNKFLKLFR